MTDKGGRVTLRVRHPSQKVHLTKEDKGGYTIPTCVCECVCECAGIFLSQRDQRKFLFQVQCDSVCFCPWWVEVVARPALPANLRVIAAIKLPLYQTPPLSNTLPGHTYSCLVKTDGCVVMGGGGVQRQRVGGWEVGGGGAEGGVSGVLKRRKKRTLSENFHSSPHMKEQPAESQGFGRPHTFFGRL